MRLSRTNTEVTQHHSIHQEQSGQRSGPRAVEREEWLRIINSHRGMRSESHNQVDSTNTPGSDCSPSNQTDDIATTGNHFDSGNGCSGKSADSCSGAIGGRLNLLLSYAGWQSDPWVDRLPRLLEPMGITSLRASSGRDAGSLIANNRIHVAVVDLALPLDECNTSEHNAEFAEGGPRILEILARLPEPPPVVAVKRGRTHRDDARELSAALRLGAFAVVDRPHDAASMNTVLDVLRRCMERYYRGCWPGVRAAGG